MDFTEIMKDYFIVPAFVFCLVLGYAIKHITWLDKVGNEYIPLILAIIGAIVGCLASGEVTVYSVTAGMASGLASTGFHQIYKQYIENQKMYNELKYMGAGEEEVIGATGEVIENE